MLVAAVIIIYLLVIISIGIFSFLKIKTPEDFYISSKNGGIFQISGSLLATILGGSAILGTVELSQKIHWAGIWLLLSASLGLFILGPISKKVSRHGQYTLPEMIGVFFGVKTQKVSSLIISISWLGIISAQIIAAAQIISTIGLINYTPATLIGGLVFIFYTFTGGQKSILKTDVFQSFLIISGILILFFILQKKGPPKEFIQFNTDQVFHTNFTFLDLIILIFTYSVTYIVGPDIYSRIFCAKSAKTATYSVFVVAILLIPIAYILTFLGVYSTEFITDNSNSNGLMILGSMFLPDWAFAILVVALLSAVMSSADTTLLTASMILSELSSGSLIKRTGYINTKIFIVILGILSIILSNYVTSIIDILLLALAFFSGAFTIPVLCGLLKIKTNKYFIIQAIISGGIIALTGKIIANYYNAQIGNYIIISAFLINSFFLFFPFRKNQKK